MEKSYKFLLIFKSKINCRAKIFYFSSYRNIEMKIFREVFVSLLLKLISHACQPTVPKVEEKI